MKSLLIVPVLVCVLAGCGVVELVDGSASTACGSVREEFEAQNDQIAETLEDADARLARAPVDYSAQLEQDADRRAVVAQVLADGQVAARIVTNNPECFNETDLAFAQQFLDDPGTAMLGMMND